MSPTILPADHAARMERVRLALDGLSVGDAFGERFFSCSAPLIRAVEQRALPQAPWKYTDDTVMALAIAGVLDEFGRIDQEALAQGFARRYAGNPRRGYGATAHLILSDIARGVSWRQASAEAFDGEGSMGNGGAMRVAPVGAYFADDMAAVVADARASAEVTHGHREGQAGAIAIAVAAAWAWQTHESPGRSGKELLATAARFTPPGDTRSGLLKALTVPFATEVRTAVEVLGNGSRVTAPDTVPFALWCAARSLNDYETALWATVSGAGDIDTNCAIVGGILALANGPKAIPEEWLRAREWVAF
ncbi:MAG TPA: ADP-ribosylglycohydrolase family protein [Gemmataceae bacterium]|nr:ADP-ribosylglycohydrolase family protein [Gemmataceae bacterium]